MEYCLYYKYTPLQFNLEVFTPIELILYNIMLKNHVLIVRFSLIMLRKLICCLVPLLMNRESTKLLFTIQHMSSLNTKTNTKRKNNIKDKNSSLT